MTGRVDSQSHLLGGCISKTFILLCLGLAGEYAGKAEDSRDDEYQVHAFQERYVVFGVIWTLPRYMPNISITIPMLSSIPICRIVDSTAEATP